MTRIIAVIAVYNERLFIGRCLRHLRDQGIQVYILDHQSTDDTRAIVEQFRHQPVIGVATFPRDGLFRLEAQMRQKETIVSGLEADWFVHHDADEIREAPRGWGTLAEAIAEVDRLGYNAINFDEFTFVPTSEDESFEARDYVQEMKWYYYFAPKPLHHVKAWKNMGQRIDLHRTGGHQVHFEGRRIFPEPFILRHYIGLSKQHLIQKYCLKMFDPAEVQRGWHGWRAKVRETDVRLPPKETLHYLDGSGWCREHPKKQHLIVSDRLVSGSGG